MRTRIRPRSSAAAAGGSPAASTARCPALLLTGSLDAITPPGWAGDVAEGLSRARFLEFPGRGHDVVSASEEAQTIVVDFLDRPEGGCDTGSTPGARCAPAGARRR